MRSSIAWQAVDAPDQTEGSIVVSQLISGLIGVVVGALLTAFIQWVAHRHAKQQRLQHLILVMCSILDEFCSDCQDAIEEEGDEHSYYRGGFIVPAPTVPAFPAGVDWTVVDLDRLRRFLELRLALPRADKRLEHIWNEWAHPPEMEAAFAFRREKCSEFLQEALELSAALRKKANPPIWEAHTDACGA